MLQAGKLDSIVLIQARADTRNADGGLSKDFRTIGTMNVRVISQGGREWIQAKAVNAELTHLLEARYRVLDPSWRLLLANVPLNILTAIDVDNQHRKLQISCKQQVGQ